jgi:hypothetical protein
LYPNAKGDLQRETQHATLQAELAGETHIDFFFSATFLGFGTEIERGRGGGARERQTERQRAAERRRESERE